MSALIAGSDPTGKNSLLRSAANDPIGALGGGLNTHDADVHQYMFNHFFVQETGVNTTLAAAASKGNTSITVTSATGFTIGDRFDMHVGTIHMHAYFKITNIVGNVFTLDQPLFRDFPLGSEINETSFLLNVNGSLASPQTFRIEPYNGEIVHITNFIITMTHGSPADDTKFGGITALTNGMMIRIARNNGASYENVTTLPWIDNAGIKRDVGGKGVQFVDRVPSSIYGTNIEGNSLTQANTVIRLDSGNNDYMEILIQDNLTGLTEMQAKVQGHLEG